MFKARSGGRLACCTGAGTLQTPVLEKGLLDVVLAAGSKPGRSLLSSLRARVKPVQSQFGHPSARRSPAAKRAPVSHPWVPLPHSGEPVLMLQSCPLLCPVRMEHQHQLPTARGRPVGCIRLAGEGGGFTCSRSPAPSRGNSCTGNCLPGGFPRCSHWLESEPMGAAGNMEPGPVPAPCPDPHSLTLLHPPPADTLYSLPSSPLPHFTIPSLPSGALPDLPPSAYSCTLPPGPTLPAPILSSWVVGWWVCGKGCVEQDGPESLRTP